MQRDGRPLADGNGLAAHLYVGVLAFRTTAAARRFVADVRERFQVYDGRVSLPVAPGKGGMYTPGQDGVGTISDVVAGRWHGWQLHLRREYVFDNFSHSADLYTVRSLVSRGRFVCGGTFDARSVRELRRMDRVWPALLRTLNAAGDRR